MRRPRRAPGATRGDALLVLRERNGRLFFGGLLVSSVGTWAQGTGLALLVKRLAEQNEGQALGVSVMLQFLPMLLLGAWAGAFADQRNRRRLTIATQSVLAIQALTLTVVDFSGHASLPIVYALTLVLGIASAIDNPARRGLVLELVDRANISNAMSINTATMTGSRVFGPALAAWLVISFGTAWCFLVNALSFVAVIAALLSMDATKLRTAPPAPRTARPVREGLAFVWASKRLRLTFVVMAVVSTFGFNYIVALPLLADRRFGSEAAFGWMLAITGLGSFCGSLFLASKNRSSMRIYLVSIAGFATSAIGLAWAPNLSVAYLLCITMGFGGAIFIASANILTQNDTPDHMRSRMLALTAVAFLGSTPIGGPITGWVADHVSAEWSLAYGGMISLACAVAVALALVLRSQWVHGSGRALEVSGQVPRG